MIIITKGGEARFNNPVGVAVDQDTGEVYVSDKENNIIRVINQDKRNNFIFI